MAYTITEVKEQDAQSPVYACKIVATAAGDFEVPCGFYPSRVEIAVDASTDSYNVWTADMEDAYFCQIAAAASMEQNDLILPTAIPADITERVNGFLIRSSSIIAAAGTFYVTAHR